ncbi:MAG: insulinase family protein [Clostridia bacterium]|nr:insulinase family protein [Clostridia bacterium]
MEKRVFGAIGETLFSETLPNGLKINVVPKPGYCKAFAMFATNYGGADRRFKLAGRWLDTPAGVAHYLEHKMFDMPDGNALSVLSANGASPNAFTSSGITAYHFDCTEKFYENLEVLLKFVSTPYFTAESVQKEQGIIGQEIRMVEDSPDYIIYNNLLRCLYEHNPVRDSVAGTVESIAEITEKTLYYCHEVFYNPSNMTLAVVGNAAPEKVVAMARKLLPAKAGEVPERDYGDAESENPHRTDISAEMAVSAPQFLFGARVEPEKSGEARLRQCLMGKIALRLLLGRSSPAYNKLYADGLLSGSFDYEFDYTAGTAMLIAGGESRDIPAVMAEIKAQLAKVVQNGIDGAAFENAKKSQFGDELRALGSFSALSLALANGSFAGYCPLDGFDILSGITKTDVETFISENLAAERLALSVLNPKTTD